MKNKNKNTVLEFYRFSLVNKAKEQQVLSFYNEEEDLLDTLNDFCNYIFENVRKYTDNQGKLTKKIELFMVFLTLLILENMER
jgi:hypothetical protein